MPVYWDTFLHIVIWNMFYRHIYTYTHVNTDARARKHTHTYTGLYKKTANSEEIKIVVIGERGEWKFFRRANSRQGAKAKP